MGAGVAANPHCPVPSAEPGWATASSPGFRVARGAEAPRGPAGSLFQGIAAFASGSPAGSSFRSIAAPASGPLRFLIRYGIAARRHPVPRVPPPIGIAAFRVRSPRVPCSGASLRPRPVPLRVPRSEASLLRHPVPPSSCRDIAVRPVPVRVAFAALLPLQVPSAGRRGPKALPAAVCVSLARRLPVPPGWRESGSGIGRSLCLTLLPSSPCLPPRSFLRLFKLRPVRRFGSRLELSSVRSLGSSSRAAPGHTGKLTGFPIRA
jgi:hypothetical protein